MGLTTFNRALEVYYTITIINTQNPVLSMKANTLGLQIPGFLAAGSYDLGRFYSPRRVSLCVPIRAMIGLGLGFRV